MIWSLSMYCMGLVVYVIINGECKKLWFILKTSFYDFNNIVCNNIIYFFNVGTSKRCSFWITSLSLQLIYGVHYDNFFWLIFCVPLEVSINWLKFLLFQGNLCPSNVFSAGRLPSMVDTEAFQIQTSNLSQSPWTSLTKIEVVLIRARTYFAN